MAEPSKHTLYANTSQTRFYWLPDEVVLPSGPYVLRSLTGARLLVDEAAAEPYKITEDRAKELTREVVTLFTQRAGTFLSGLGAMMQEVAKKQSEPRSAAPPPQDTHASDEAGGNAESGGDSEGDPDAMIEGLKKMWDGLQASAREVLDSTREVDAATRDRIKHLAEAASSNLDAAEASVDELRGKFREFLADAEMKRRIDEATKRLRELAEELGETFRTEGNRPADAPPSGANRPADE